MKKIAAGEFKAKCLRVMDEVQSTREPVIITKKGRPVAKLVPLDEKKDDIFGCLVGTIEIQGDIESSVIAWDEWDPSR